MFMVNIWGLFSSVDCQLNEVHKAAQFKMASGNEEDSDRMEIDKTSDKSSDNEENQNEDPSSSSSDEDDEKEGEKEKHASELEEKITANPYDYSAHVDLINTLRSMAELDRLRQARERMCKHYPLSAELWLAWLEDEIKLASSDEEKESVKNLFERAVKDYLSVELWLEYAQFSIGFMGQADGVESVRSVFERSLTAAGIHAAKGVILWEAYREFENVIAAMLEPKAETSPEDKEKFVAQMKRIGNLYRRQLSCPLLDMERSLQEYETWLGNSNEDGVVSVDKNVEANYKKALTKLNKILPFEMQLMSTPDSKANVFRQYLVHEQADGEPARVQCLYERSVAELCLDPALWLDYVQYLDTTLKIDTLVLPAVERAVRNCPWSSALWQYYLRVLERYNRPHGDAKAMMEQALAVGFSAAEDYRGLWQAYLDYLRRRLTEWKEGEERASREEEKKRKEDSLAELRAAYNRACEHLAQFSGVATGFGLDGDPGCSVLQSWARMEAIHGRDMEAARKLWSDVMSQGNNRAAAMWLEYIALEKSCGDTKHLRRLYQRALTAVHDWPESIGNAWLTFERDEGSLDSLEACESKYKARMKQVQEQKDRLAAKETEAAERAERKRQMDPRTQDRGRRRDSREPAKRKLDEGGKWASVAAESVVVKASPQKVAPPPGYKASAEEEPPSKKKKKQEEPPADHGVSVPHNPAKDNRTVFISNLEYTVEEAIIRERFSPVGTITDLRLVKDFKGRFKGYGYVEFSTPAEAAQALKKDREQVGSRPMFVSKCDPDRQTRQPVFKYSNQLEKKKLFIKGLPLTTTKEDLEEMYKPYGTLKEVRLVTYRNGHSKGLAYVEFQDEASAAHALIKTDNTTLSERTISVAISQPPERKAAAHAVPSLPVPSLGGGPKETGARGRGRIQMFVPSSLQRAKPATATSQDLATANGDTKAGGDSKPKSNSDFRQMLLSGKK